MNNFLTRGVKKMKRKHIFITIGFSLVIVLGITTLFLHKINQDPKHVVDKKIDSLKSNSQGEFANATSERNKIMDAKTGAPITDENIREAREQIRKQGIVDGPFSDLDIAKIIDKANSESLDYKTSIEELYPGYLE